MAYKWPREGWLKGLAKLNKKKGEEKPRLFVKERREYRECRKKRERKGLFVCKNKPRVGCHSFACESKTKKEGQ